MHICSFFFFFFIFKSHALLNVGFRNSQLYWQTQFSLFDVYLNNCGGEYQSKQMFECLYLPLQPSCLSPGKVCRASAALMKQIEPTTLCEIPQFLSSVLEDITSWWIKTDVCAHICMFPSLSYWFPNRGLSAFN